MGMEEFRWLAAAIAAHPRRQLSGRTRLQKTIYLLQRCGFPTTYTYTLHFYGPYSEELVSDAELLDTLGLVAETVEDGVNRPYYRYIAREDIDTEEVDVFAAEIALLADAGPVVLELAATYDAFRELGYGHEEAMRRVKLKKGATKCTPANLDAALKLLSALSLPNAA